MLSAYFLLSIHIFIALRWDLLSAAIKIIKHNLIMQYFIAYMPEYLSAWVGHVCDRDHARDRHRAGSGPDRPVIRIEN